MTAELCVAEARKWIGTKWRHRGRNELGIDCIGLVIKAISAGGVEVKDRRDYSREPWRDGLRAALLDHLGEPVDKSDMQPGDVVLMKWANQDGPGHVGVIGNYAYGGLSLIHAYSMSAVCEHGLDEDWRNRIVEVYRPWHK